MIKQNKSKSRLCSLPRRMAVGVLIFVLCLGMTACAPKSTQITIDQLIEANSTETLLNSYTSIYVVATDRETYVESGLRYLKNDTEEEIQTPDNAYGCYDGEYRGAFRVGGKWAATSELYSHLGLNATTTAPEVVESVETDGDTITLHMVLSSKEYASIVEILGYAYQEGDYAKSTYKLDAKTLAILEFQDVLYHADGTSEKGMGGTLTYNAPRPESANALLARLSDPQNLRTLTVIANPGTEQAQTSSVSAPKGEKIGFEMETDGEWVIYSDAECTQVYSGGASKDADLTLYCKQKWIKVQTTIVLSNER